MVSDRVRKRGEQENDCTLIEITRGCCRRQSRDAARESHAKDYQKETHPRFE